MKYSMMSLCAGNLPPAEIAEIARSGGMSGIEWLNTHNSDGRTLKKVTRDAGLEIASYVTLDDSFRKGDGNYIENFKYHLEQACQMEAPFMMIPPFPFSPAGGRSEDRKRWIAYFQEVTPLAQAAGMLLTLESTGLPGSPVISTAEVREVLDAVPETALVFDNGNVAVMEDPLLSFRALRSQTVHIHLKDLLLRDTPADGFREFVPGRFSREAVIGDGTLDLISFLDEVESGGYSGFITLESRTIKDLSYAESLRKFREILKIH